MPLDGITLTCLTQEFNNTLTGARITRVYQPKKEIIILQIRASGRNQRLLLSSEANEARVHLTSLKFNNPPVPPLFCMVLRKHLEGGRIKGFHQPEFERILHIRIESPGENKNGYKTLVAEMTGKNSNLILLDEEQIILDGIKRYNHLVSRHREVLPGKPYIKPPSQDKLNPLSVNEEDFRALFLDSPLEDNLAAFLFKNFRGLSPVSCREIVFRTGLSVDTRRENCGEYEIIILWKAFQNFREEVNLQVEPVLLLNKDKQPVEFSAIKLTHLADLQTAYFKNMSEPIDEFYRFKEETKKFRALNQRLKKVVSKEFKKNNRKLQKQEETYQKAKKNFRWKKIGELLTANLYRISNKVSEVELNDFSNPEAPPVKIELNPQWTPAQNAQNFFKLYTKAKNTEKKVGQRLKQTRTQNQHLVSVLETLNQTETVSELEEIEQELQETGYLSKKTKSKKKTIPTLKPMSLVIKDDFNLLVGKNNKQNDYLTLHLARPNDIWLHVKNEPGAHVLLRTEPGKEVIPDVLEQAAQIAAYYSRVRNENKVEVDYTLKKYVRKPKQAPPGLVYYVNEKTLVVNPEKDLIKKLLEDKGSRNN